MSLRESCLIDQSESNRGISRNIYLQSCVLSFSLSQPYSVFFRTRLPPIYYIGSPLRPAHLLAGREECVKYVLDVSRMSLRAVTSVASCGGYALRSRLASSLILSTELNGPLGPLGAKRHLPKRGTKPLPQYLWDEKHLEELTGGQYTHKPLRVNRLGGRDPETGWFIFTRF